MKCAKEFCHLDARPGQKYCSKKHAPYGELGDSSRTPSARTAAFSTPASGELSPPASRSELELEDPGRSEVPPLSNEPAQHGWSERAATEYTQKSSPDPGGTETPMPTEEKSESEDADEILSVVLPDSFTQPLEAMSHSANLISDSVKHLHALMKLVAPLPRQEEFNARIDPQKVNAACNAAKNITNLMRMQLDVYKAMKEVNKND